PLLRGSAGRASPPRERGVPAGADRGYARQAARLLSAEFPLPIGRLADGGFGTAIRHAGRGAVQRLGQCDAPTSAVTAARALRRPRSAPPPAARRRLRHWALSRRIQADVAAPASARGRSVGGLPRGGQASLAAVV